MENNDTLLSKWCDQMWLCCVYLIGIIMGCIFLWKWEDWETAQKLMCMLVVMLSLHIFEENTFPGGFAYMNNLGMKSQEPLVYPQNRLTNMWTNLGGTLFFSIFVFLTPKIPGVCITIVLFFGIAECIHHTRDGIGMYKTYKSRGKKTIYGPGLLNSYYGLLPLSIMAVKWITKNHYTISDFSLGLVVVICFIVLGILIPFAISFKVKSKHFAFRDKGYFDKFD